MRGCGRPQPALPWSLRVAPSRRRPELEGHLSSRLLCLRPPLRPCTHTHARAHTRFLPVTPPVSSCFAPLCLRSLFPPPRTPFVISSDPNRPVHLPRPRSSATCRAGRRRAGHPPCPPPRALPAARDARAFLAPEAVVEMRVTLRRGPLTGERPTGTGVPPLPPGLPPRPGPRRASSQVSLVDEIFPSHSV